MNSTCDLGEVVLVRPIRRGIVSAAVVALVVSSALLVAAPASAAPVGCTSDLYFTTSPSSASIVKWAPDGTSTAIATGALSAQSIGLNPVDGYLYALSSSTAIGNHLFRVEDDGTSADLGALAGLPTNTTFAALGFAADGTGWVSGTNKYKFDIGTMTATSMGSTAGGDIASLDGSLYGWAPGRLARIDQTTGATTTTPVPGLTAFGAIWASDGHLYVNQGTAVDEILDYATATPTLLALATSPSLAGDGASCPTAPSRFLAAIADDFSPTPLIATAGGTTHSVFSNDTAAGAAFAPSSVTASLISDGGLTGTTIAADGTLTVPANQTAGSHTLQYRLCSVATPTLCDLATVAVTLAAPGPPSPAAAGPSLAPTGIDILVPTTAATASILLGLIAVAIARRRRTARY